MEGELPGVAASREEGCPQVISATWRAIPDVRVGSCASGGAHSPCSPISSFLIAELAAPHTAKASVRSLCVRLLLKVKMLWCHSSDRGWWMQGDLWALPGVLRLLEHISHVGFVLLLEPCKTRALLCLALQHTLQTELVWKTEIFIRLHRPPTRMKHWWELPDWRAWRVSTRIRD